MDMKEKVKLNSQYYLFHYGGGLALHVFSGHLVGARCFFFSSQFLRLQPTSQKLRDIMQHHDRVWRTSGDDECSFKTTQKRRTNGSMSIKLHVFYAHGEINVQTGSNTEERDKLMVFMQQHLQKSMRFYQKTRPILQSSFILTSWVLKKCNPTNVRWILLSSVFNCKLTWTKSNRWVKQNLERRCSRSPSTKRLKKWSASSPQLCVWKHPLTSYWNSTKSSKRAAPKKAFNQTENQRKRLSCEKVGSRKHKKNERTSKECRRGLTSVRLLYWSLI